MPIERKSTLRQQHVEHLGERRHFEHRAVADRFGSGLLARASQARCRSTIFLRRVELPRLRDHREHDVERLARGRLEQRARLRLHQPVALEREAQRAPAHRRILLLAADLAAQIGQLLVAADVDGAEHHRLVARGVEHVAVEPRLPALARGKVAETRNWNSVRNRPMPSAPVTLERGDVVAQAGIHHHLDARPSG